MKKILLILLVLVFKNAALAQNTQPNDCVNAIVVCGNGTFSSNASGAGKQEVAGCTGFEHNSLWMKITIAQAGTLGFDLIPNDPSIGVDYDFWVYGPNKTCASLGSPTRCCTTNPQLAGLTSNHTGMKDNLLSTTAGPGANGTGYVRSLNVAVGEVYYIAIDRPIGNGGFQIQWTGTATNGAGAFPTPPTANKILDQITCTSSTVGIFNLDLLKAQINSEPNTTIAFYATLADAVDGQPTKQLPSLVSVNIANPKPIFAKVVNTLGGSLGNGCYSITDFTLRVFPIPDANIKVLPAKVCPGENVTVTFTGTPGATVDYTVDGGPTQSVLLDATGIFLISDSVSSDRTYALTRAKILDGKGQEVCFTAYNPARTATVTVNPLPTISGTLVICIGGTSQLTGSGTPAASTPWASSDTTIATVDPITGLVTGIAVGTSNITYTDSNGCSTTSVVTVSAGPTVTGKSSICVTGSTQLTGSGKPSTTTPPWASSDPSIATVNSSGLVNGVSIGTVTITYTDVNGCSAVFSLDVKASNNTQSATAEVSNFFDDNQTITVTVVGDATYLYSLDGGEYQTSNVFTHVAPGLHTVNITDTQGCTDLVINNILAIGYPHFFTPNNDGYNDTWNITSLTDIQPDAEIFIFDRYGKLLKRITPSGAGWDGTYNGQPMPSSDYWFTIKYLENGTQKSFKSHFSLKR